MKTVGLLEDQMNIEFVKLFARDFELYNSNARFLYFTNQSSGSESEKKRLEIPICKEKNYCVFLNDSDFIMVKNQLPNVDCLENSLTIICEVDFTKEFSMLLPYIGSKVNVFSLHEVYLNPLVENFYKHLNGDKKPGKNNKSMTQFLKEKVIRWIMFDKNRNQTEHLNILRGGKIVDNNIIKSIKNDF